MRHEGGHVNKISWLNFLLKFHMIAPAHLAMTGDHLADRLHLSMMVNNTGGIRSYNGNASPNTLRTSQLARDGSDSLHTRRLWRIGIKLVRLDNAYRWLGLARWHRHFGWIGRHTLYLLYSASIPLQCGRPQGPPPLRDTRVTIKVAFEPCMIYFLANDITSITTAAIKVMIAAKMFQLRNERSIRLMITHSESRAA